MLSFRRIGIAVALLAGWSPASLAAGDWGLCGGAFVHPTRPPIAAPTDTPAGAIALGADSADLVEGGISVLTGNVELLDGERLVISNRARYDQSNERMEAEGEVRSWDGTLFIGGDRARVDFADDSVVVDNATFMDLGMHGRGGAERISVSGSDLIEVRNGRYTTCNPGDEAWSLDARELELDKLADVGTVKHVTVRFKGVPIFYSPYLTFPLSSKRKSGFLTPSFRLSGQAGTELTIPYYFNIAPNQDATASARLTTERGVVVGGEYRYLYDWGSGELEAELLPHDPERGDTRGLLKFRHRGNVTPRVETVLWYDRVSDSEYFEDLGNSLRVSSATHLRQLADVVYDAPRWSLLGRLESYQTVDRTIPGFDRPYKRLPQFLFRTRLPERNRRLHFSASAEYVHFDREASVTGDRIDVNPALSLPMRGAGWFVEPRASLRHTTYSLNGTAAGENDDPSRTLPTMSLDAGLFLDRPFTLGGRSFVHTLEPRAFYLVTPFDDQRDIPLFDTGEFTFNFAQLFRTNRFSGVDRIGDAHQLTVALTSRLLSREGRERVRASIGQIRFFRDRTVNLTDGVAATNAGSAIVAEVAAELTRSWSLRAGFQWDTGEERTDKNAVAVRFQPDSQRVLNLSYRFVRGAVEQVDLSARWPWDHNLSFVGRVNYSLRDDRVLETFGGVEYDSCCWAMRAIARRYLTNPEGDYNNAVFLQLELKGLAGLGRQTEAFVKRSIPGYENDF